MTEAFVAREGDDSEANAEDADPIVQFGHQRRRLQTPSDVYIDPHLLSASGQNSQFDSTHLSADHSAVGR